MLRVRLETRSGAFVHDPLIPPFVLLPEIVCWGARMFVIHDRDKKIYREGIAWWVLNEKDQEAAFGAAVPRLDER
jgi:hypothetical protein